MIASEPWKLIWVDGTVGCNPLSKHLGVMDMFITFILSMASQEYAYVRTYQFVHVKNVQFMVHQLYQLYLNKPYKNESKSYKISKGPGTV